MTDTIHRVEFKTEFRVCPLCGYKDGFHTMLRQEGDALLWLFICPSCSEMFDIGQKIPFDQN